MPRDSTRRINGVTAPLKRNEAVRSHFRVVGKRKPRRLEVDEVKRIREDLDVLPEVWTDPAFSTSAMSDLPKLHFRLRSNGAVLLSQALLGHVEKRRGSGFEQSPHDRPSVGVFDRADLPELKHVRFRVRVRTPTVCESTCFITLI